MVTSMNAASRLENLIDGLETLVLSSSQEPDALAVDEQDRLAKSMRQLFVAGAIRAKIAKSDATSLPLRKSRGARRKDPLAVRLRELALLLKMQPNIEPRLLAVFESKGDVEEEELDRLIQDVGRLISSAPKR